MSSNFTSRPVIVGRNGVVTSSHYLATLSGIRVLEKGGNAFDAAAAVGFSMAVLEPHMNSLGGEVPVIFYSAKEDRVVVVSGQGPAPQNAKIEWFKAQGLRLIPGDGFLPLVVPSMVATWIEILKRYGTMSLKEVASFALELAENGIPMSSKLRDYILEYKERFLKEWPTTAKTFLPNGKVPEINEIFVQPELANTLRLLIEAERSASEYDRIAGLEAARSAFYEGIIAQKTSEFVQKPVLDASGKPHQGFITEDDFARYKVKFEEPVCVNYGEYTVFKCGPWTQGPVFLQQLNILEEFELSKIGHNSADYIHLLVEAAKLAFADREKYYGDPEFDHVPLETLLSKKYAALQGNKIDMNCASDLPIEGAEANWEFEQKGGDTTHFDVIDKWGNMVSATQSGGWIWSSPLIEGLGFALSTRAQISYLDPRRNNCLAPNKRPRTTLTPTLVYKNNKPFMIFGTPGGDQQDQWTLQFFLNYTTFGMNLQQALDAPSFHTLHFPSSFYPRRAHPKTVVIEDRVKSSVIEELRKRGHVVKLTGGWQNGRLTAAVRDFEKGVLLAAASPKADDGGSTAYAFGW
ncbi:hypothetical protein B9Q11_02845 [Candidatus Marsarchaeota G2 archaeon ECH_B_SAG-F08]|uniref:Gamma-glutamyltransferase n=1 Tax=Candidatus Marsarchaeota G2 archaeon ECH_B_SAG-F08 TaxID=1978165 RepID=A0A2R6BHI6_9ARCH|nr:MAG: hypothetical protein B9Q11_02845 [Candidatus Marsarchaeota G2 archaeon ECH_B_SAG-F08]